MFVGAQLLHLTYKKIKVKLAGKPNMITIAVKL